MIKRVFTFFLMFSSLLFANQYNDTIVDIEAKIFPKIALLEESVALNKSKYLKITILAQKIDFDTALSFQKSIEFYYPKTINNKKITVSIQNSNFKDLNHTDAIISLYNTEQNLKNIALFANQKHIISFAYDPSYLTYGFLSSIYIGKSTQPYFNTKILKSYNFIFDPYLMQLSKFY